LHAQNTIVNEKDIAHHHLPMRYRHDIMQRAEERDITEGKLL
jgi:hypothetical protein